MLSNWQPYPLWQGVIQHCSAELLRLKPYFLDSNLRAKMRCLFSFQIIRCPEGRVGRYIQTKEEDSHIVKDKQAILPPVQ